MRILAYAKINLCLSVVGTKGDKHLLDSVFYPAPVYDEIIAEKSDETIVEYTDGRVYERDTAVLAARAIQSAYQTGGAKFLIKKNIPEGAGLGGSSADAGAVARAYKELYGLKKIDDNILLKIGSDVPYFYYGGCKRVRGEGEIVEELSLPELYVVAVAPHTGVSTAECYRLYDKIGGTSGDTEEFISEIKSGNLPKPFNALSKAARTLNPEVEKALAAVTEVGFVGEVTGSGSAVFAVETDFGRYKQKLSKLIERAPNFRVYARQGE